MRLQRWGFDKSKLTVLSHSNGSVRIFYWGASRLPSFLTFALSQIVHGWLVKTYPGLVVRSAFVDPVCFCTFHRSYLPQGFQLTTFPSRLQVFGRRVFLSPDARSRRPTDRVLLTGFGLCQLPLQALPDTYRLPYEVRRISPLVLRFRVLIRPTQVLCLS